MIDVIVLAWVASRVAVAMIDCGLAVDRWLARHTQHPRTPWVYEAPASVLRLPEWVGETRPLELVGGSAAGSHGTAPAPVLSPPPAPDTQPLRAVAAGPSGTGPVEGPARSRRGRHASGRVRWPLMRPIGVTPTWP